jgi:hypothetical protein
MFCGDAVLDMYLGALHYEIFLHRNITVHLVYTLYFTFCKPLYYLCHSRYFFEKLVVVHTL